MQITNKIRKINHEAYARFMCAALQANTIADAADELSTTTDEQRASESADLADELLEVFLQRTAG